MTPHDKLWSATRLCLVTLLVAFSGIFSDIEKAARAAWTQEDAVPNVERRAGTDGIGTRNLPEASVVREYPVGDVDLAYAQKLLGDHFGEKAFIELNIRERRLIVNTDENTQAEIRGVLAYLARGSQHLEVFAIGDRIDHRQLERIVGEFGDNARIAIDAQGGRLLVQAPHETTAQIRGVLKFLSRQATTPASGDHDLQLAANPSLQQRLLAARQQLRAADNDQQKQQARAAVRQSLAEIFDEDMRGREQQAQAIEARIATLRQQFAARAQVKDQIIDLQLEVLANEAAGLGFPGAPGTSPQSTTAESSPATPPALELDPAQALPPSNALERSPATPASAGGPPPENGSGLIADYELLRRQYHETKDMVRRCENTLTELVTAAQASDPNTTLDDVRRSHRREWERAQAARAALARWEKVLQNKLKLLDLDVQSAIVNVRAAQSKSEALHEAYKSGGAAKAEVDEQRARYQEAELQLQRAQTILDLYATIADAASESAVPGEPASNNLPPAP